MSRGKTGARAGDLIERWKRGAALLLFFILIGASALVAAGIPMMLIAEVTGDTRWSSIANISTVAAIAIFPWIATSSGTVGAFQALFQTQSDANRDRAARR
ncbi:hypothetical protein [Sphingobium sp. YR768]|uniref:hypothetical protein n=1 Tax=Sphingobium sp. YR768 TaxID=1884365 RepID=UPI0008BFF72E|nr:hypothetical protein [Sphingobium sp. YR768]SEQ47493.1 hypothetical protein SAMN05518866_10151 [Sphingobium sp. YR768]